MTGTQVSTQVRQNTTVTAPPAPVNESPVTKFPMLAEAKFVDGKLALTDMRTVMEIAHLAAASGFFKDVKSFGQGLMKISYGIKLGMDPFESLNDIYAANGQFGVWAKAIARKIKESARYDYQIIVTNLEKCVIRPLEDGKPFLNEDGTEQLVEFNIDMAKSLKLLERSDPWRGDRKQMLFYKAITRVKDMYFPDIFNVAIASAEDIIDVHNVESYDRMSVLTEKAKEVAKERKTAADLDKVFDEVEEIPFEDEKPTARDVIEAGARMKEEAGFPEIAQASRETLQAIDNARKAIEEKFEYGKLMAAAVSNKNKGWSIKKAKEYLESQTGIKPEDQATQITRAQFDAAMEFITTQSAPQ